MTFQKKHKLGFTTDREKPMTASVSFRIDEELAQDLKSIPHWQTKLRDILPELIKRWNEK
jgi:uncharacterized protein (DUF4415 family)